MPSKVAGQQALQALHSSIMRLLCSVHLVLAYDGRPTGNAFVEFLNPMDAKNAMVRDRQMLGNRYVELFASSREEVAQATGSAY